MDNTTAISYLNKIDEPTSLVLSSLACNHWKWGLERSITVEHHLGAIKLCGQFWIPGSSRYQQLATGSSHQLLCSTKWRSYKGALADMTRVVFFWMLSRSFRFVSLKNVVSEANTRLQEFLVHQNRLARRLPRFRETHRKFWLTAALHLRRVGFSPVWLTLFPYLWAEK